MKKAILILEAVFLLFLCACSNDVDSILEDYNKNFEPYWKDIDEDFEEEYMLLAKYPVTSDSWLRIPGPFGCDSYEWFLYKVEDDKVVEVNTTRDRIFSLYLPDSKLEAGKAYRLRLTATSDGKEYIDSCEIIVYEPIGKEPF